MSKVTTKLHVASGKMSRQQSCTSRLTLGVLDNPSPSPLQGYPPSYILTSTDIETFIHLEGTERVKCLVQEHNAVSQVRAQYGVQHFNQEATLPTNTNINLEIIF